MRRTRTMTLLCVATLIAASTQMTAAATPAGNGKSRPCISSPPPRGGPAREVLRIAEQAKSDLDLKSVLLRVTVDGKAVITAGLGESMTGVPAEPDMHFRAGSVVFPFLGTTLLQLVEEGKVSLDDPVSKWLPDLPKADKITLRMLGSNTTGIADYVTDPDFLAALEAAPFRHWTPEELVGISLGRARWYEPGTNWSYSHANYILLSAALEKITGTRLDILLRQRATGPLGLRNTTNSFTPDIPQPVLHSFTSDRGKYEESTFWNPSWTTAPGAVITTDICDLARSAEAVGTGELLSPSSFQEQLDPGTVGLGRPTSTCPATICLPNTEAKHDGLGVLVFNGWILQNPSLNGFAAVESYLPAERLAIAVAATKGENTPAGNTAETITDRIAAALAPGHLVPFGG